MSDGTLTEAQADRRLEWFEATIPVRGCYLSLPIIKDVYLELSSINRTFGERVIANLLRPADMSEEDWEAHKRYLLSDAFRLTVTITGKQDQLIYASTSDIFESRSLPDQIKTVYFTNITAFRKHANGSDPVNRIEVLIDFDKPHLLDPSPLLSQPTPNNSNVKINADDIAFFRAVQRTVETKLNSRRNWYAFIHESFSYDIGVWVIVLPVAIILSTYYMDLIIPVGGRFSSYRWGFFIYSIGMMLIAYRFLSGYVKWAFPVNILSENSDSSLRHRLALGAIATAILYEVLGTIYRLLFE